jgi:hypothetical protein
VRTLVNRVGWPEILQPRLVKGPRGVNLLISLREVLCCGVTSPAPSDRTKEDGEMGYQWGWSGYLTYHQDNSEYTTDQTNTVTYAPADVGAPAGAVIQTGLYNIAPRIDRGNAGVLNPVVVSPEEISFPVWTQAADNGLFGHHSGESLSRRGSAGSTRTRRRRRQALRCSTSIDRPRYCLTRQRRSSCPSA